MVALSVQSVGRSQNNLCRHNGCREIESLGHVLGFCPEGELLRITRHNTFRTLIADCFRARLSLLVNQWAHKKSRGCGNQEQERINTGSNRKVSKFGRTAKNIVKERNMNLAYHSQLRNMALNIGKQLDYLLVQEELSQQFSQTV